jgi:hypothetical protein
MALSLKDPEADRLAREIADRTGEDTDRRDCRRAARAAGAPAGAATAGDC